MDEKIIRRNWLAMAILTLLALPLINWSILANLKLNELDSGLISVEAMNMIWCVVGAVCISNIVSFFLLLNFAYRKHGTRLLFLGIIVEILLLAYALYCHFNRPETLGTVIVTPNWQTNAMQAIKYLSFVADSVFCYCSIKLFQVNRRRQTL